MKHRQEILDELNVIAPNLVAYQGVNTYTAPANYFEQLPAQIMQQISMENYTVPAGYFEALPNIILQKIKQENELVDIAPALAALPKVNVYTAPNGYFETFTVKPPRTNVKVISLFKYAAAAVVVGLLGLFVVTKMQNSKLQKEGLANMEQAAVILKTSSVDAEINKLNPTEVEQYLTQTGTDIEAGLVAVNAFEDKSAEQNANDELFDDETLNSLLESNTTQN
jgi:hypothetical protein